MNNDDWHITMKFGAGIDSDTQGRWMLWLEKSMREAGVPVEVFKETMQDDSKLRSRMTPLERAKL